MPKYTIIRKVKVSKEMKKWITSDLHFGHTNIMKFCPVTRSRFTDVDHMNATMIKEWNESVQSNDEVYILGDIAFCNVEKAIAILDQLNGTKILVEGNHDEKLVKDERFRSRFKEIHKYLRMSHDGHKVVMFHFPILEWDRMHHGSVHFYGHVHGDKTGLEKYRARDAGFDATGKVVSSLDEMIQDALKGEIKPHH